MKAKFAIFIMVVFTALSVGFSSGSAFAAGGTATCSSKTTFFGIPTWYEYLTVQEDPPGSGNCVIMDTKNADANVAIKIVLAGIDILTRVAAMAAVGFVVYGGFLFVSSQGEPAKIVSARKTIMNAVIGLVIALLASQIVKFIAKLLS